MKKITINQGKAIPLTFRFLLVVIVVIGAVQLMIHLPESVAIPLTILLSLAIPIIWFMAELLIIDPEQKTIQKCLWIMGYKIGKVRPYNAIEKTYVNQVKTSQNMYSQTNRGHTVRGLEYHAYLKLDSGEKHFLFNSKSQEKANEKLTKIREKLGLN